MRASSMTTSIAVLLFVAPACENTRQGVEKDTAEAKASAAERVDNAGRAVELQLTNFRRSANEGLARIDGKIREIQNRIDSSSGEVSDETRSKLQDLKKERDRLAQEISEASAEANAELEAKRHALDESIAELGEDADEVLNEMGDDIRKITE